MPLILALRHTESSLESLHSNTLSSKECLSGINCGYLDTHHCIPYLEAFHLPHGGKIREYQSLSGGGKTGLKRGKCFVIQVNHFVGRARPLSLSLLCK